MARAKEKDDYRILDGWGEFDVYDSYVSLDAALRAIADNEVSDSAEGEEVMILKVVKKGKFVTQRTVVEWE